MTERFYSEVYKSAEGRQILAALYQKHLSTITAEYDESFVDTRFGRTHIISYGSPDGQPVLGFHGGNATNPYSLRAFTKHVDLKRIRFIVPDTIGNIGLSAEKRLSSGGMQYGEWACDILDALALDSVPVFGGSYGGGIALRLASFAPERISRLMLFVPSGIANSGPLKMSKIGIPTLCCMLSGAKDDDKLRRAVAPMMPQPDDEFVELFRDAILYTKFEMRMPRNATVQELKGLKAPVYVIAEKRDCLFPGEAVLRRSKELFCNLSGTQLLDFGGHGAFLKNERTHFDYYDTITEFLTGM